jgi:hypothetical protein
MGTYPKSRSPALEDGSPSDRHSDAQAPDRIRGKFSTMQLFKPLAPEGSAAMVPFIVVTG